MPNSVLRTNLESVRPSPSTEMLLLEFSLIFSDFLHLLYIIRLVNIPYVYASKDGVGIRDWHSLYEPRTA